MNLRDSLIRGDLTFISSLAVVIVLPVYVYFLPPVMIFWGVTWLLQNDFRLKKKMFLKNKAATLFVLFIFMYLWQISGLLLADSLKSGFDVIFKRLSFMLFPLVLFYPGDMILKNVRLIVRIFAISTFIYVIYCFGNALYESMSILDGKWRFVPYSLIFDYENYFYGFRLSHPAHPSYLAMYIIISALISFEYIFDNSIRFIKRVPWLIILIVFFLALYFLSSRAGTLASLILFPVYLLRKLYEKVPRWILLGALPVLIASIILIAGTNDRLSYTFESINSGKNIEKVFEKDVRYSIWKSSISVIKKNILTGVGTGDASTELKKEFKNLGYNYGYYNDLNAHNQYLEVLLENGLIGLVIFLFVLGYMLFIAVSEKNLLYGLFILMILISFSFESVLNRLAGITFFSLFSFLLVHIKPSMKIKGPFSS